MTAISIRSLMDTMAMDNLKELEAMSSARTDMISFYIREGSSL